MNKTALFFICLIAPIAFAQHDILSLIDKTPEGKEVLDHLFVQTRLMGENLDVPALQQFLKANTDRLASEKKTFEDRATKVAQQCHDDGIAAFSLVKEQHERYAAVSAQVRTAQSVLENIKSMKGRFDDEEGNLSMFAGFVAKFKSMWAEYYQLAQKNQDDVNKTLRAFLTSLRDSSKTTSFIELPQSYHTSLAQIKSKFEYLSVDLKGMAPIAANLLEIMQSEAIVKPEVAIAVRGVVNKMIQMNDDRWDLVEQQNEHNTVVFTQLEKFLNGNSKRAASEVKTYGEAEEEMNSRIGGLKAAANQVESLINQVDAISQMRNTECKRLTGYNKDITIKNGKISAIIDQITELLLTQKAPTTSFFLQKQMRLQ